MAPRWCWELQKELRGLDLWKKRSAKESERWSWRRRAACLTFVGASVLQHGPRGLCQAGKWKEYLGKCKWGKADSWGKADCQDINQVGKEALTVHSLLRI